MPAQPMAGVRILEVAQFTFTPSAGAVLADWGADVIKVEHAETGDAQRGLVFGTGGLGAPGFHPLMEHANRGKRSVGLALELPSARQILMDLAAESDVFLTNFLPEARQRLRIDVDDLRRANPSIIYVRGTAHGTRGPDANRGGFDGGTFWCRAGSAAATTPPDAPRLMAMPGGGYGDSIGGMTLAGGIAAALFARDRTGEPSVVDVSLLSVGTWAMGLSIDIALVLGQPITAAPLDAPPWLPFNPTIGTYRTSDGRWVSLTMLQPGRYWEDLCRHLKREDLIDDERFDSAEKLISNAAAAGALIAESIASRTYAEWVDHFSTLEGQWAPVQDALEVAQDVQVRANGYISTIVDADGTERELVANPVQFDETPPSLRRAPGFAEHTDGILRSLGRTDDEILALKLEGAVT